MDTDGGASASRRGGRIGLPHVPGFLAARIVIGSIFVTQFVEAAQKELLDGINRRFGVITFNSQRQFGPAGGTEGQQRQDALTIDGFAPTANQNVRSELICHPDQHVSRARMEPLRVADNNGSAERLGHAAGGDEVRGARCGFVLQ